MRHEFKKIVLYVAEQNLIHEYVINQMLVSFVRSDKEKVKDFTWTNKTISLFKVKEVVLII